MGLLKALFPQYSATFRAGEHLGNRVMLRGYSEMTADIADGLNWDTDIGTPIPAGQVRGRPMTSTVCVGSFLGTFGPWEKPHRPRTLVYQPVSGSERQVWVKCLMSIAAPSPSAVGGTPVRA